MTDETTLLRATRERLLARIIWWETYRTSLLVPLSLAAFGLGLGLGFTLERFIGFARGWVLVIAVVTLLAVSRSIDWAFRPSRLSALDARIGAMTRGDKAPKHQRESALR